MTPTFLQPDLHILYIFTTFIYKMLPYYKMIGLYSILDKGMPGAPGKQIQERLE